MHEGQASKRVLPVVNLREFFKDALHGALEKRHLEVEDQTEHYVVNVLTLFSRSEALYDTTSEGKRLKPLVVMLSEALEAPSTGARNRGLQRLGDVSLFVAGFFAQGFARKLIDIDYHIAMGGRACPRSPTPCRVGREKSSARCSTSWPRSSNPWWTR